LDPRISEIRPFDYRKKPDARFHPAAVSASPCLTGQLPRRLAGQPDDLPGLSLARRDFPAQGVFQQVMIACDPLPVARADQIVSNIVSFPAPAAVFRLILPADADISR